MNTSCETSSARKHNSLNNIFCESDVSLLNCFESGHTVDVMCADVLWECCGG